MLNRKGLLFLVMTMLLVVSACSNNKEQVKVNQAKSSQKVVKVDRKTEENQKAIVEKFIQIAYFDKGTYKEFTALYANPKKANKEKDFNKFRKQKQPKDMFPKDYQSIEKVKPHLVVKQIDQNNANVYWLENPAKDKTDKATLVWSVTKVNGTWLLN